MGTSEDSLRKYVAAVAAAVATQKLDRKDGEMLTKAASVALRAIKQRSERHDVTDLIAAIDKLTKHRQGTAAEQVADRYGQGADASAPGRWPDSAVPSEPKKP